MSRIWLIDNKAFNTLKWSSFIRESLSDLRIFFSDLNITLNDNGTLSGQGLELDEQGNIKRPDTSTSGLDESHHLYQTNRGALLGDALTPDGFDNYVLETFQLPVEARFSKFNTLYKQAVQGYGQALLDSWQMIPDSAKLVYTLHLWEHYQKGKLPPGIWATTLMMSWPHGKVGPMLFRANLAEKEIIQMFRAAPFEDLMYEDDLDAYNRLPSEITIWRGVSSLSKYKERGFSWTHNKKQAEWFAYANSSNGSPMVIEAKIKKESILLYSSFENEVVVNPTKPLTSKTHITLDGNIRNERLASLRKEIDEENAINSH